jgi:hypothetical protein
MSDYVFTESSNLEKATWKERKLEILFRSGLVVEYQDIPEGVAVGLGSALSAGSYMNKYICGEFSYVTLKGPTDKERLKFLEHHYDATVGLWATDKPDAIPEDKRHLFFQIKQ